MALTAPSRPLTPQLAETCADTSLVVLTESMSVSETHSSGLIKSPYDQVREYLDSRNNYDHEAGLSKFPIQVPLKDWPKLEEGLESVIKHRWFSYNSITATLEITSMAAPVHESVVSFFYQTFCDRLYGLPYSLRKRVDIFANQITKGFDGRYRSSRKVADLAVEFISDDESCVSTVVFEVGFSESYKKLIEDAKLWLEGKREVSTVILVKLGEKKQYRDPTRGLGDEDLEELQLRRATEIRRSDFTAEAEGGPIVYKGLVWVEEIATAFIEVWKRDPGTGLAHRIGGSIDILTPKDLSLFRLRLGEFLDISPENEREIFFEWNQYQHSLKAGMKKLAALRYQAALEKRRGRASGVGGDHGRSSPQSS